jgi:pantoate--beta-alanine ligase
MDTAATKNMKIFHTVSGMRDELRVERLAGKQIGFVPTMGNLHEGHLQLVCLAAESCDVVVASIFVNPLQFGLNEDWEKYPRTFDDDVRKLESAGCNYLFYPDEKEIYPNGMADQTRVVVPTMTDILCGASRPGHFEGVTTVVSKLLNIVQPDRAIFGIKDFQQLAVIRRMVEDLCIPVDIIGAEIARDHDGLALSSRNSYLTKEERSRVKILYETLCWCREEIVNGRRDFTQLEESAIEKIEKDGFRIDYVSIRNAKSLEPAAHDDMDVTILGAMYATGARLIDNVSLNLNPGSGLSATVGE